jgi:transposase
MSQYHNFIGIDIGKYNFVAFDNKTNITKEYENNGLGFKAFIEDYKEVLSTSLCVLETTGGYELELLYTLCELNLPVHRADTRKVKNFIRSFGNKAKTDALDAKALAKYGMERAETLEVFKPQSTQEIILFQLVKRRDDLKRMLVAEKNRLQTPSSLKLIRKSCERLIKQLNVNIEAITQEIKLIINNDPVLKEKQKILKTIPGIGDIVAFELLILLPELGQLDRRKIASLAGLAPMAKDSGRYIGYRKTGAGRSSIKPILFVAAMAARNSKSELKTFYENLIARGKKKMVALVALMRKILVIANTKLKSL